MGKPTSGSKHSKASKQADVDARFNNQDSTAIDMPPRSKQPVSSLHEEEEEEEDRKLGLFRLISANLRPLPTPRTILASLDRIGSGDLIRLAIANHEDCHYEVSLERISKKVTYPC